MQEHGSAMVGRFIQGAIFNAKIKDTRKICYSSENKRSIEHVFLICFLCTLKAAFVNRISRELGSIPFYLN